MRPTTCPVCPTGATSCRHWRTLGVPAWNQPIVGSPFGVQPERYSDEQVEELLDAAGAKERERRDIEAMKNPRRTAA